MTPATTQPAKPWYREPWPWILMSGPAVVVVAGFITLVLAIDSNDGLVADDYYKRGKEINRDLSRDAAARAAGMAAALGYSAGNQRFTLTWQSGNMPDRIEAEFAHATRSGQDRRVALAVAAPGRFMAAAPPLPPGRWRVTLGDADRRWRLTQSIEVPASGEFTATLAPQ